MASDDVTLLIRLPPELKTMYQALCKSRKVSVSERLRQFMISEITGASLGSPHLLPSPNGDRSKCDKTPDMFDDDQNCVTRAFNENYGHLHKNTLRSPLKVKSDPQTPISSAIKSQKLRKKAKKR